MKSNCGAPAFKLQDGATDGLEFTFIEFEDAEMEKPGKGKGRGKAPKEGMPSRSQAFEDAGDQGLHKGQKKPPRKNADGTIEDGEYMEDDEESADGSSERPKRPKRGKPSKTRGGYGAPTKGKYDPTQGGYKTFGTEGQGNTKKGARGDKEKCSQRKMYVTVSATEVVDDSSATRRVLQASEDTTVLEFGAFPFLSDVDGAFRIGGAIAGLAMAILSIS